MKKTILFIIIIKSFLFGNSANAQLVSGSIYLQNPWVEVGIAPNGSFGTGPVPAGYTANAAPDLGIMYDWGHDGWTVGTPPNFGDYVYEGTTYEGWAIEVNGARSEAYNSASATTINNVTPAVSSATGSNTIYTYAGGVATGVWQGTTTGTSGGLTIRQTSTIDTNTTWLINHVVLINTSGAALPGVYYLRTLDPDGDEYYTGNFATNNKVIYQNDALHRVMVESTGTIDVDAYATLAAKDCRAKAFVEQQWPLYFYTYTLAGLYAGTATATVSEYNVGLADNGDYATGIIFSLGTIAAGDSAVFSYAYTFSTNAAIDSAFPESVIYGPTSLCIGSTITLSDPAIYGTWSSSNSAVATINTYTGVVGGVAAGTVTITYTLDTATCRTAVTYTVTVTNGVAPITGPSNLCTGATANFSDATSGGTWSVGNTSIATIDPTGLLTGITTGSATITYAIGGGCLATTTLYVGAIIPAIAGDTTVCIGATITLSSTPSGGTWSSSNTNIATVTPGSGIVSGVLAGAAVITYNTTCAAATTTITVIAPPGPIIESINPCTGNSSGISDAVSGGTWSSGNINVATISSGTLYAGAVAGTTIISYTNSCGTATQTLTINARPMTFPGITVNPLYLCIGGTTTLSNDGSPVGTWSSSNIAVATINATTGFLVSTGIAGTTTITAQNLCGSETETVVISSPGTISGITTFCQGTTTTLSDNVASGTWSSGSPGIATVALNTGVVTGVAAGAATITYTIPGGCFTTATVTVEPSPHAIAGYAYACTGATTTLSDSPTGGTWSSGATGIATISGTGVVSGIAAGTATITYTLAGDCFKTTTVTVYTMPAAIAGTNNVCTGLIITLSDAVTGGTWSSGNPATATVTTSTGVVRGITAGTAIITYTTGGNCIATYTITVKQTPSITAGSPNICTDGTTTLTATPGGGAWSLSSTNVATIAPSSPDSAIIYGLGVTTGTTIVTYSLSGCTTTKTVTTVHVLPPITGPSQVCTGRSITLSNAVTGGTWTSDNTTIAIAGATTGIVTGVSPGDTIISYTIGGSCITTATVMVNLSPNPGLITGNPDLCVGATITLSDTVSGGIWSISNGSATISGDSITGVSPGTDTVRYMTTSLFCGAASDTLVITVTSPPNAGTITGDTIICFDASITLSDIATGGVWSSSNNTIATISGELVSAAGVGVATISYTVTNACDTAIATHKITVYPLPSISPITGPDSVCAGAVFILSDATPDGVWSAINTSVLSIDSAGNVVVFTAGTSVISYKTGPNAWNCYSIDTFVVTVTPHGTYTVSGMVTEVTCNGADNGSIAITVSGSSQIKYTWSNGDSASAITNLAASTYTVTVTDTVTQCITTTPFIITQPDSLVIAATAINDTCDEGKGSVITNITGGTTPYTYLWSDNKTEKDITGLLAGTYSVTITDSNGCAKSIAVMVNEDTCYTIIIHNVITPNGDGINDTWVIDGIQNYPANTVQIFDKWGDMIYEKTGYNNEWGGKGKSGEAPDGTYYYLVKLNAANLAGGQNTWTGYLMIKR